MPENAHQMSEPVLLATERDDARREKRRRPERGGRVEEVVCHERRERRGRD